MDAYTDWGEVFNALTTTEQECIRDTFDADLLESVLDRSVMSESDTPEAWEISMFSCLAPQTARAVFLALLVAGIEKDGAFRADADAQACLDEWVAGIDVFATMVALSADDAGAAGEVTTAFMRCHPDLFISSMLEQTGMTLEDLNEEEATCLREWAAGTDWATLLASSTDDPSFLGDFVPDLIACAPDLFISSMLEDTGLTLDDLSEEEATCLREWATGIDWATLLAGDDFAVLLDFLPDLFACAPDLFISSVLEDTGLTLEDLSEEEASCLREWVTDFDWSTLFTGFADDSMYLFELLECVPDLSWSEPGDLPWGQVIEEATPLGIGVVFQGELDDEGDSDYFIFEAEEGEFYQLDVTLGTLEDSVLDLYDADGIWLDANDDYGDSTASRLVWDAPATGTYYVQVASFDTGTGTYTLTISGITDDHANSAANAVPVEIGMTARGAIDYEGDGDYFIFEAEEGVFYQLDVTLGTLEDSVLDIFDTYGIWLDGNDDSPESTASRLYWTAPGTGTYYVRVTGFDVSTGTYTLTIAVSDIVDDHPDSTTDATPVEIGVAAHGAIDYEGDSDYFTFEAEEGESYQLDVTLGTLEDSILELFDADGIWLDANDDFAESTASRLVWLAPGTGTYYILVGSFRTGTGTGTYTLTIATAL
ncbi:MAG: PPC domain-containing protein [bacterium]|nr:PPC domain-containing protein [bacterium]MDE0352084.1 PPC domain-containing protein [bacterium]